MKISGRISKEIWPMCLIILNLSGITVEGIYPGYFFTGSIREKTFTITPITSAPTGTTTTMTKEAPTTAGRSKVNMVTKVSTTVSPSNGTQAAKVITAMTKSTSPIASTTAAATRAAISTLATISKNESVNRGANPHYSPVIPGIKKGTLHLSDDNSTKALFSKKPTSNGTKTLPTTATETITPATKTTVSPTLLKTTTEASRTTISSSTTSMNKKKTSQRKTNKNSTSAWPDTKMTATSIYGKGNKRKTSSRNKDPSSKSTIPKVNKTKSKEDKKQERKDKKQRKKDEKQERKDDKRRKKEKKKQLKKERKEAKVLYKKTRNRLKMLKRSAKRRMKLGEKSYMKSFVKNCSLLLKSIKQEWRDRANPMFTSKPDDEKPANSYQVLQALNTFGKDIAFSLGTERMSKRKRKESFPISGENIDMEISVVATDQFTGYVFPDPSSNLNVTESIKLPPSIFTDSFEENGTIISIVYDAFYEMYALNATENYENATVNSKVLSTTVYPHPPGELEQPVEIVLKHLEKPNSTVPECVFWKVNESDPTDASWSTEGCTVFASNITHTVCHCNHLTDFAVLFRVSSSKKVAEEHKTALTLISLVGCLLSSVCLLITVIVLLILRKLLRSTRNFLHLNLAIALLIANVFFLLADQSFSIKMGFKFDVNICLGISICLFYFFLVAFFMMLGEGIYVWIMVAKAFSRNLKKWMYFCIGWGIPLVIVGASYGILQDDIVANEFCWLSVHSGAIWAFIGTVIFVTTVNFCILLKVLHTAVEHQSNEGNLKVSARLTFVLMPVLGLTWLFGVFAINKKSLVFEYLFTIVNSFQGLFIFICYILLNGEVKAEYQKIRAKKEYSQTLIQKSTSTSNRESRYRVARSGTQDDLIEMVP